MPAPAYHYSASDLSGMLAAQMLSVVAVLLPHGKRQGREWRIGGVDGTPGGSCRVILHGQNAGNWTDFTTGEFGDALDLVAVVLYRGDKKAAYRWALQYLGLGGTAPATRAAYVPEKTQAAKPAPDYHKAALRLYLEAIPSVAGTPADFYLKARGLDLAELGRQPRALRFHPRCHCSEIGATLPALIAAVTDANGAHVATHRTYLGCFDGEWGKAKLRDPKKTLGQVHGGTIRLWRGASNKPLRQAPDGEPVVIGEGIETCLSVAIACPELRVLCGVSMSNAASITLPDNIGDVVLLADNDGPNEAARRGLQRVVNHFTTQGRTVRLARSPWGKDFNDAIQAPR